MDHRPFLLLGASPFVFEIAALENWVEVSQSWSRSCALGTARVVIAVIGDSLWGAASRIVLIVFWIRFGLVVSCDASRAWCAA